MISHPQNLSNYLVDNKSTCNIFWPYSLVEIEDFNPLSEDYQFLVKSKNPEVGLSSFFKENRFEKNVKIVIPREAKKLVPSHLKDNIYYFSVSDSRNQIPSKHFDLNLCDEASHLERDLNNCQISYPENFMDSGLNLFLIMGIHKMGYFSNSQPIDFTLQTSPLTPFHTLNIFKNDE